MLRGKINKIILLLVVALFTSVSANAEVPTITPDLLTSQDYLKKQGYSKDIVFMVNLQKSRSSDGEIPVMNPKLKLGKYEFNQPCSNFLRNLIFKNDLTLPVHDFGTAY